MQNSDHLSLDGRSLHMLKLIHDHRSVTITARQMGVNQSTVSHSLERLRGLLGDPLFLKVGRSMVPTERMDGMIEEVVHVLSSLQSLHDKSSFDPLSSNHRFTVIGNDFEHDMFVPSIYQALREQAPNATMRTHVFQEFGLDCLKEGMADVALCPLKDYESPDIVATTITTDRMVTFYDPTMREAPKDVHEYADGHHGILALSNDETTAIDITLRKEGLERHVSYCAPSFGSVANVARGTDMLATAPSRLAYTVFRDFDWVEVPIALTPMDFHMVWHVRNRHSPRHRWFRELVKQVAKELPCSYKQPVAQSGIDGRACGAEVGKGNPSMRGKSARLEIT
ncbi:MAG TPA: LysR family transcriptional regulator [Rhizobiales bacterium]|nr:LysR family transcriptional regulator [Hyphomicrobiales bacterium]